MSVYIFTKLFYLLLFLLMCGTFLCGHVCADSNTISSNENAVEIFKAGEPVHNVPNLNEERQTGTITKKIQNIYFPFLVATDDVLIATARIKFSETLTAYTEILTKYIDKEKLLGNKGIASSKSDWTTQLAIENKKTSATDDVTNGLLAAGKGKNIYLLLVISNTKLLFPPLVSSELKFKLKFVVGAITIKGAKKEIEWDKDASLVVDVTDEIKKHFDLQKLTDENTFSGKAFITHDGQIVYVLRIYTFQKNMFALINLSNNSREAKMKFVSETNLENCNLHFFPWKEKIIMLPVSCKEKSKKKIMESNNMGTSWEISEEALSRHYNFLQYKQDFAKVTIDKKELLLFGKSNLEYDGAQPAKTNVHLWMTDGNRLQNIGAIIDDINDKVIPLNFLFANDKLFFLYQQMEERGGIQKVTLKNIQEQVTAIKKTIKNWDTIDSEISKLCKGQDGTKIPCTTDGLVVFLSGTDGDDITWENKYSDVNAKVTKKDGNGEATKVPNGFTFKGEGVGAQWPGDKQIKDQPYNFKDPGFTLVATVTIGNGTNNKNNSILGVSLRENNYYYNYNNVGLWCTTDGEWAVTDKTNEFSNKNDKKCERGNTYGVALILNDTKLSIYVNGEKLTGLKEKKITPTEILDHFYFGVDNDVQEPRSTITTAATSDVTITNVLLYNRPFNESEIEKLQPKINNNESVETQPGNNKTNPQTPDENTQGNKDVKKDNKTGGTKNEEDKQSPSLSPPPTTEDSAARVGVVGVLCFMLFGVFTSLGRYVY